MAAERRVGGGDVDAVRVHPHEVGGRVAVHGDGRVVRLEAGGGDPRREQARRDGRHAERDHDRDHDRGGDQREQAAAHGQRATPVKPIAASVRRATAASSQGIAWSA